jgi:hypothetical protein
MEFVLIRLITDFSEWKVYGDFVETYAEHDRELRTECLSNKKLWKN